jgi:predicted permease
MRILGHLASLWNTLLHKERLDRELDDELRAAVETLADRYVFNGMSREAALRKASAALGGPGGIAGVRDEVREARIGAGLDAFLLDLRYAWRGLWRTPGFTFVIVSTLALGIGANTAIFSVVNAMLLQPLPYRDANCLLFIWLDRNQLGYPRGPMSGPDLRDLRERTRSFTGVAGIWATGSITLTGDGEPEQLRSAFVTTNFFQVLGAESALGRTFRSEDSAPGAEPTVLLGWDVFQRRFGGDPMVVGRKIGVNDGTARVIGVMPKHFRLLLPQDSSVPDRLQVWTPFWPDLENGPRRNLFMRVIARMRQGVTVAEARADVDTMAEKVSREIGTIRAFTVVGLQDDGLREIRGALMALFASVGILLAIACVNVASLLIARAASRARETAVRLALGASRSRLLRQALVEGLLLTVFGAATGVAAGYALLRVLLALTPASLSRLESSHIDSRVFAFTIGVSVLWGLLFSLAPLTELFRLQSHDPSGWTSRFRRVGAASRGLLSVLASGSGRSTATPLRYRVRVGLILAQIALSTVLLVTAGLLVRAFVEVLRVDPGFRVESRHLTFRIAIPERYESREAFNSFADGLRQRLAAIPGVTRVGLFSHIPYDDVPNWGLPYSVTAPIPPDASMADSRAISPGLFETLGARLVDGRVFSEDDRNPGNPIAIIDDLLARRLWPNQSALGRQLYVRAGGEKVTVVGVVRHLRLRSLVDDLSPQIFVPWALVQRNPFAVILATSVADPSSLAAPVRTAVTAIDPRVPIYELRPLTDYVEAARSTRRFTMLLAAAFALTALVLTCVGIYGVLAYAVAHRRHEFGVRRALGADTGQVIREVLREGVGLALAGCVAGLAVAAFGSGLLQSQLYSVDPSDPISYSIAVALIVAGAAAACWIPAYRATTVSPMDALRTE